MKAPQIIYLALQFIGLLVSANKHGQPRENYNFWTSLVASVLMLGLMLWGGFFK